MSNEVVEKRKPGRPPKDSLNLTPTIKKKSVSSRNKEKNPKKSKEATDNTPIEKEITPTSQSKDAGDKIITTLNIGYNKDSDFQRTNNDFINISSSNFTSLLNEDTQQIEKELKEKERKFIVTGEELLKRCLEKMPCLVEPIFQQVGLAAIAGSSDTGKSSLLRDLAIAICTKKEDYLGWKIYAKHHSVIYVSTEDDEQSIGFLLHKQNIEKQLLERELSSLRYIFDTDNILENLEIELEKSPADLILVDAFSDLYDGSLNDSNQVRCFLNKYNQLAQRHKCLIIFLHHTGKRTDDLPPSKHNLLGSQGFEAKMRVVIELRTDRKDANIKHLCIVKGNYLTTEQKQQSYVLQFTENMTFHSTGERVPLDNLKNNDEKEAKRNQALKLKEQGMTQQEIAEALGYANKSSISKLLNGKVSEELPEETNATSIEKPNDFKI